MTVARGTAVSRPHSNGRFATMGKDFAALPEGTASHQTRVHAQAPAGPELLGRTGTKRVTAPCLLGRGRLLYRQLGCSPTNAGLAPSVAEKRER